MNAQVLIPLIGMVFYAFLGTLVIRQRPLTREAKFFLSYLIIFMLWSFGSVMVRTDFPPGSTYFWNQLLAFCAFVSAVAYFHFAAVFLRKPRRYLSTLLSALFVAIVILALAKGYVIDQAYVSEGTYHVQFGLGFYIVAPLAYSFVIAAIYRLAREFKTANDPFVRNRAGYLLVGISIVLLLNIANFVPSLAQYPIDQLGNVINALLIGYAILKYRLLDIDVFLRKGLFYSILTGLIMAIYFIIASLIHIFFQVGADLVSWITVFIVAVIIAALFHPFYQESQRYLDRLFNRKKYDYREMLRTSSQAMSSIIDLGKLTEWILGKFPVTIGAKKAAILLLDDEKHRYYLKGQTGYDNALSGATCIRADSPLATYLNIEHRCLTADEIDRLPQFRPLWQTERDQLAKLNASVIIPLRAQDFLIGLLILGSKESGEIYTNDDLDLLCTVANHVATAVRNAQLYDKSQQAYKELKKAQERVILSERLKALGEMTSGITHDFNNILTSILGRAQLALDEEKKDRLKKHIKVIERSALDAAQIILRLQDFARVRTDHVSHRVDLDEVVKGALEIIRPRLSQQCETENSKIAVNLHLGKIQGVAGDEAELREAVVNIMINALEAMPSGGALSITTEQRDHLAVISISDTGVGMTAKTRKRIFEPFFTSKGKEGLGMGLSVVYGIVKRHKGDITVSSEPHEGSTFMISLPIGKAGAEKLKTKLLPAHSGNGRVLIVDDDEGSRSVLSEMLHKAGYVADTAASGDEAIMRTRGKRYDLVVTDLGMSDRSGLDVAKEIRKLDPEIRVLLVTGWGIQVKQMTPQVDGVVSKPFRRDEILARVADLLSQKASNTNEKGHKIARCKNSNRS